MKKGYSVKIIGSSLLCCALMSLIGAGSLCSAVQESVPRISIQELKKVMDAGKPVTIIDVQPKDVYKAGHIKGALSIPWKSQIALEDVFNLPTEKPVVTYCDCGPGESDSADVASQLLQMGFDDVKVLGDPSIKGWKAAGYPMEKE
jgi:phage shock protein E